MSARSMNCWSSAVDLVPQVRSRARRPPAACRSGPGGGAIRRGKPLTPRSWRGGRSGSSARAMLVRMLHLRQDPGHEGDRGARAGGGRRARRRSSWPGTPPIAGLDGLDVGDRAHLLEARPLEAFAGDVRGAGSSTAPASPPGAQRTAAPPARGPERWASATFPSPPHCASSTAPRAAACGGEQPLVIGDPGGRPRWRTRRRPPCPGRARRGRLSSPTAVPGARPPAPRAPCPPSPARRSTAITRPLSGSRSRSAWVTAPEPEPASSTVSSPLSSSAAAACGRIPVPARRPGRSSRPSRLRLVTPAPRARPRRGRGRRAPGPRSPLMEVAEHVRRDRCGSVESGRPTPTRTRAKPAPCPAPA